MREVERIEQRRAAIPTFDDAAAALALDMQRKHLDELLDEALRASFPASDPSSVGGAS